MRNALRRNADGLLALPLLLRGPVAGSVLGSALGGAFGLIAGLAGDPATAWFAVIEGGVLLGIAGGLLGLLASVIAAIAKAGRR